VDFKPENARVVTEWKARWMQIRRQSFTTSTPLRKVLDLLGIGRSKSSKWWLPSQT